MITHTRGSVPLPTRTNICALIITYYPEPDVAERVAQLRTQLARTIVVDNGSGAHVVRSLTQTGAEVIGNAVNRGLAAALNQGVARAVELGYPWTLLLDQDSTLVHSAFEAFAVAWETFPDKNSIGLIAARFVNQGSGDLPTDSSRPVIERDGYAIVKTAITSGSLLATDAWQVTGRFRDEFFIDCIDHDYCLRLRAAGFQILRTDAVTLAHRMGSPRTVRIAGRTVIVLNHSPVRRYYIVRNRLAMLREHLLEEPAWMTGSVLNLAKELLIVVVAEQQRLLKLIAAVLGVIDAARDRMGPLDSRWARLLTRDSNNIG